MDSKRISNSDNNQIRLGRGFHIMSCVKSLTSLSHTSKIYIIFVVTSGLKILKMQ